MLRIYFILIITVYSCQNSEKSNDIKDTNIDSNSVELMNGTYKWSFHDTDLIKIEAEYKDNSLHGEKRIYYRNGNLKELHHYETGYLSGVSKYFYENGEIEMEKEFIKFYESDTSYVNWIKKYDRQGNLKTSDSFFYELLNVEQHYLLGSICFLDVKLVGAHFEYMHITTGTFDENFNLIDNKRRYYGENSIVSIPIPTDSLGVHDLNFIINDYTYTDLIDSTVDVYQILVNYKYEVTE